MTRHLSISVALSALVVGVSTADEAPTGPIAPYLDRDVMAVCRVDLTKLDLTAILGRLLPDRERAAEAVGSASPWLEALRKGGARSLFMVVNLEDLPLRGPMLPLVVVPLAEGDDRTAIARLLCGEAEIKGPWTWKKCGMQDGRVLGGSKDIFDRLARIKPEPRPDIEAALRTFDDAAVILALTPAGDVRRTVEELMPNLPRELGPGPITTLTRGLKWAGIGLTGGADPGLRLVVQAGDEAANHSLEQIGGRLKQYLIHDPRTTKLIPDLSGLAERFESEVKGDRITLTTTAERARSWAQALFGPWQESEARRQCVRSMMQIGLAMHNYHSTHDTFPPAFRADKAGKPLLSWRVLILPYLDQQQKLYKEFHLDEPWDSPHNLTLVERIPDVFRCPDLGGKVADRGKTSYLVPRGKGTVFTGAQGMKIKAITDGTSNTVLVLDAGGDRSVTWTKPEDWDVEADFAPRSVLSRHPGGTSVGFADGSVRFIKTDVNPDTFRKLLTPAGGEVFSQDEF